MKASAVAALSDCFVVVERSARPCDLNGHAAATRATHAAVVDEREFLGLVELEGLPGDATEKTFGDLALAAVGSVVTERTTLEEAARLLLAQECQALPLLQSDGSIQGIITARSLLKAFLETRRAQVPLAPASAPSADELERLALQRASDLRRANRILQAEMSERLKAEAAQRRSALLLRSVVDNVPAFITRLHLDGTLAYVNQPMPGFTREQMLGKNIVDLVAPPRREAMARTIVDAATTGRVKKIEAVGVEPAGHPAVFSWRIAPVHEGERITGLIGIATDVTEAKQAEDQLRYFAEIVESIQIGLYVFEVERYDSEIVLRCVSANPATERLTGVPASEILGRRPGEVFGGLRRGVLFEMVRELMRTGRPVGIDDFWYHDERIPRSAWSFTMFRLTERRIGIAFQNVTERKQAVDALIAAEELNRLILKAVPAGIAQVDRDGRIVSANEQAQEFFGLTQRELLGRTAEDFGPDCVLEDGTPCPTSDYPVTRCLATNLPQPAKTIGVPLLDGSLRWGLFSAMPLPDPELGDCRGAVVTFLDITERKKTEEQTRELQGELAHVLRLSTMGEMASGLAHELNQPLAAIIAYADASQELVDSERIERTQLLEVLRAVSSQAERAGKIIHRLRSLIKKNRPNRAPIQVNDAIREVAALLESEARGTGAQLRLELDEQLPATSADFVLIQQVLLNLLRNSMDALAGAEPHRRELAVFTRQIDTEHVEVAIRDRGRGIASDHVSRLFEPFFTTKAEGLGLGLPISRTIIEAHGGRLWLAPNPDAGMTAKFVLPIRDLRD